MKFFYRASFTHFPFQADFPISGILLLKVLHILDDKLYRALHAQDAAVNAQVIAVRAPPFLGGIIIVIALALLILLDNHVLRLGFRQLISLHNALYLCLLIRINEKLQYIVIIRQCIIRAASHYDAGTLLRNLFDGVKLRQKYLVADRQLVGLSS